MIRYIAILFLLLVLKGCSPSRVYTDGKTFIKIDEKNKKYYVEHYYSNVGSLGYYWSYGLFDKTNQTISLNSEFSIFEIAKSVNQDNTKQNTISLTNLNAVKSDEDYLFYYLLLNNKDTIYPSNIPNEYVISEYKIQKLDSIYLELIEVKNWIKSNKLLVSSQDLNKGLFIDYNSNHIKHLSQFVIKDMKLKYSDDKTILIIDKGKILFDNQFNTKISVKDTLYLTNDERVFKNRMWNWGGGPN